jgi:hypothetical protein
MKFTIVKNSVLPDRRIRTAVSIGLCLFIGCGRRHGTLPNDSSATKSGMAEPSDQKTNQSDHWHWDQAEADALREKANRGQNITDMLAYSEMLYQKRLHEPPSNQIRLPNFETGPGRPLPDYVNFYTTDDRFPAYLLCEYPVEIMPYDQSNESDWFTAALEQIRGSGAKKFPPIKWVAVIIRNRAEHKGASTFEQSFKVGAIFNATNVFDGSTDLLQLVSHADKDRHPFKYDLQQASPGEQQRWMIVERHAATNHTSSDPTHP